MANLQAYVNDGIEIYVDNETGESFASVRGYARMAAKDPSTIRERLNRGGGQTDVKYAEIVSGKDFGGGGQTIRLVTEKQIVAWLPKDNPEMAEKLMLLGVRKLLHTLANYEYKQPTKMLSHAELMLGMAQEIVNLERKYKELELISKDNQRIVEAQENRISNMEMHTTGHQDYYSLKAYVNLNKINMGNRNWSQTGKRLTDFSKKLAYEIKLVPDAKFGRVQAYHRDVLERWFEGG